MSITLEYVKRGDTVIDATCGTGRDTLALAKAVGSEGVVFAFDIQQAAIELTAERLCTNDICNVKLIHDSFTSMNEHVPDDSASAVMFNLGYLPGGDHSITTSADETIAGIECAVRAIKPNGIVTIVMYDGHKAGTEEKRRVLEWAGGFDSGEYHVAYVNMLNQPNSPPEIMWITKKE